MVPDYSVQVVKLGYLTWRAQESHESQLKQNDFDLVVSLLMRKRILQLLMLMRMIPSKPILYL